MSEQTVFAKKITTFICKECKREWVKLDGDIIHPPEECPFCKMEAMRELLISGHKIVNMGGHLSDQWLIDVGAILGEERKG